MPLVSIVTPAYNAAKFIGETIRSVQAQTISDWEMIIINDGSRDNTAEIVEAFLADTRITIHHQANAGVSAARNNGLSKAKGAFIALLDADDTFLPDNLEKKTGALQKDPEAVWTYSNLRLIGEDSNACGPDTNGKGENVLENLLLWNGEVIPGPCSNLVFRRRVIDEGVKFDTAFSTAADQDFCLQLAQKYKSVFLREVLACYRILPGSMSRNIAVMEKDHTGVYEKAKRSGAFSSGAFRRKCFSNLYLILAGSWWVNGNNKKRGLLFMWKAIIAWPPAFFSLLKKLT
ncbi:MAG TPA: glycosyltransferase [Bacteroidia bacterium]|nr:glycosyltransferase [Bacteroidia bacterium]